MVRAAVSGAIDYSRADPTNINWRLRQKLVLFEIQRQEDLRLHEAIHRQWLAYISHGGLTEESFTAVKKRANAALDILQRAVFPWIKQTDSDPENDTITENEKLIAKYKEVFGTPPAEGGEK